MELKHILHVIAEMDPKLGGVCKAVRIMAAGLDRANMKNEVVSMDSPDASYLAGDPFPIHALGPGKGPWCFSKKLIPWLTSNLCRFDVVVLHGLWLYNGYATKKAMRVLQECVSSDMAAKENVPRFFVMPHGMLDPYFQQASHRKFKAWRNWIYWKLIEHKVVNECDGILFTSEEERRLAKEPFRPYSPKKEIVIGMGIERPPAFSFEMQKTFLDKCPEIRDQPYFLFLGRIDQKKGVDMLISAYARMINNLLIEFNANGASIKLLPDKWPRLVIAGPGLDTSYGMKIRQRVSQSDLLQKFIFFPGMLQGNAKWGAFYMCEAFMLPSHQENFGIVIVESLSCGKPVLASNKINIWKEIRDSNSGYIEADTLDGTLRLLELWKQASDDEKSCMGKEALDLFETQFLTSIVFDKFRHVID